MKKINLGRKKRSQKEVGFIKENDQMATIGEFIDDYKNKNSAIPVFSYYAIGVVKQNKFYDKFDNLKEYMVVSDLEEARKLLIDGEIQNGDKICFTTYGIDKVFQLALEAKTKEEAMEILCTPSRNGSTLTWSFSDDYKAMQKTK